MEIIEDAVERYLEKKDLNYKVVDFTEYRGDWFVYCVNKRESVSWRVEMKLGEVVGLYGGQYSFDKRIGMKVYIERTGN